VIRLPSTSRTNLARGELTESWREDSARLQIQIQIRRRGQPPPWVLRSLDLVTCHNLTDWTGMQASMA
jgi:hypothetical protein